MKDTLNLYRITMHNRDIKNIVAINISDAMRYVDEANYNFVETIEVQNLLFSMESVKKIIPETE